MADVVVSRRVYRGVWIGTWKLVSLTTVVEHSMKDEAFTTVNIVSRTYVGRVSRERQEAQ